MMLGNIAQQLRQGLTDGSLAGCWKPSRSPSTSRRTNGADLKSLIIFRSA